MDHHEAVRSGAIERYLLEEMPADERGEFEEHYFDCPQCAEELRITTSFLDATRHELKRDSDGADLVGGPGPPLSAVSAARGRSGASLIPMHRTGWARGWGPALISGTAAVLLCIVTYQNAVTYPRLNARIAQLNRPSILSSAYLVGGTTRSGTQPGVTVATTKPILLSVDVPTGEQYATYDCVLVASTGTTVWSLPITAEQARDTVPIVIPAGSVPAGHYRLTVRGYTKADAGKTAVDLAQYPLTIGSAN